MDIAFIAHLTILPFNCAVCVMNVGLRGQMRAVLGALFLVIIDFPLHAYTSCFIAVSQHEIGSIDPFTSLSHSRRIIET